MLALFYSYMRSILQYCVFALSLAVMLELEVIIVVLIGVFTFECFLLCHMCQVNCFFKNGIFDMHTKT